MATLEIHETSEALWCCNDRLLALRQGQLYGLLSPIAPQKHCSMWIAGRGVRCSVPRPWRYEEGGWPFMIRSQGYQACLQHSRKKQFLMAWTYLLHSSFHFFTYSPCVSVICTVSFKGVKEINSNSPFPLLIKVMARKNGRQYQFIYHKLSISSYAVTDYLLVGLLIFSWHYFCF